MMVLGREGCKECTMVTDKQANKMADSSLLGTTTMLLGWGDYSNGTSRVGRYLGRMVEMVGRLYAGPCDAALYRVVL